MVWVLITAIRSNQELAIIFHILKFHGSTQVKLVSLKIEEAYR